VHWTFRMAPYLAIFWLILSGHYSFLLLALGAVSIALVCWIQTRTEATDSDYLPARMAAELPWYSLWLGREILVSSVAVLRRVWSPRLAVQPAIGFTPTLGMSALSQAIYANSITLTPGTLSLTVDDEKIEVHGLMDADIAQLETGAMLRRIRHLDRAA
jgi:multicomponent Na+:H+ antiporter subunit E